MKLSLSFTLIWWCIVYKIPLKGSHHDFLKTEQNVECLCHMFKTICVLHCSRDWMHWAEVLSPVHPTETVYTHSACYLSGWWAERPGNRCNVIIFYDIFYLFRMLFMSFYIKPFWTYLVWDAGISFFVLLFYYILFNNINIKLLLLRHLIMYYLCTWTVLFVFHVWSNY